MGKLPNLLFFMDQIKETSDLDVGIWMGRREAFGTVAGLCSAAEALALKRIRDEKLYQRLSMSYDEFCTKRLKSSRRQVDRVLRLLDEFGPQYFLVSQFRHVTPDEYRAIAGDVTSDGIRLGHDVIALLPENSAQVSAAVSELVERKKPMKVKAPLSLNAILTKCVALSHAIDEIRGNLTPMDAMKLERALLCVRLSASRKGARTL